MQNKIHPKGCKVMNIRKCTPSGIKTKKRLKIHPRVYFLFMNNIGEYIKCERKKLGITQEEFAMRAGLGLRFVRELEQGKETVRFG